MTDKAKAACERFGLLRPGDSVIVALSGGADSAALLHFLYSIKELYSLTLYAAHLHHGIRGAEADRDEQFCKILCENYHIPFFSKRADIPRLAQERGQSVELCGREVRYAWLESLAQARHAKIATAHHADDNAETVLFNLTRGSALRGAAGIPPKRGRIIRPLITCTRAEIEAYCADNHLGFVTDSTNLSDDYTRNKLRRQVIPVLKTLNPSLTDALLRFSQSACEAADYLDRQAQAALSQAKTTYGYAADVLLRQDIAVQKTAINILCKSYNETPESCHLDLICGILHSGGAVELSRRHTVVCEQRTLYLSAPESEPLSATVDGDADVTFNGNDYHICYTNSENKSLQFRTRRDGDTFSFQKRNITKPLGKALREAGCPAGWRDRVPCLADGAVILWCEPLGWSAQGKIYAQFQKLTIEKNRGDVL